MVCHCRELDQFLREAVFFSAVTRNNCNCIESARPELAGRNNCNNCNSCMESALSRVGDDMDFPYRALHVISVAEWFFAGILGLKGQPHHPL